MGLIYFMKISTMLISHFLFPLHEKLKKHHSVKLRKSLEKTQWLTSSEILAIQDQNLQDFIQTISTQVPYYQQIFKEKKLTVNDFKSVADLTKLPLLTKTLIRDNTTNLKRQGVTRFDKSNTGGSSGEPLIFYMGMNRVSHDVAAKWRATRWWDVDIGDKELVIWGSPVELGSQDKIRLFRDRLFSSKLLPAFAMNPSNLDQFITEIKQFKPNMLFGYPSALSLIAERAKETAMDLSQLGIKVVFVTSERLYEHQRKLISTIFNAPVANGYGGRDAGFIAHQCPKGKMHLSAEHLIVELLDQAGNPVKLGEMGEVTITHLCSEDFPFIRYQTGDIAAFDTEPCDCGRGLPVLKEIHGRTTDFIKAYDGTLMHGLALIYILREIALLKQFKIIQESIEKTQILLVSNEIITDELKQQIREKFKQRLGELVEIEVQQVEKIECEKSGKFRYVVSHI